MSTHEKGVRLIQDRLRKWGIQSEPMTAGAGTDFHAYRPNEKEYTVHVMACQGQSKAGGKGRLSLGWNLPEKNCAELVGLANLDGDQAWLFRRKEYEDNAQQKPKGPNGKFHLYFYVEPKYRARPGSHQRDFERFVINERRIQELFGIPIQTETPPKPSVFSLGSNGRIKYSKGERRIFALLSGKKLSSTDIVARHYGTDEPFNGRRIVIGTLSSLRRKFEANNEPFRLKSTPRRGPHAMNFWLEKARTGKG